MLRFVFLVVFSIFARVVATDEKSPEVTLTNGMIYVGSSREKYGVEFFGAIRYAQPPLGALRFSPPLTYKATKEEMHGKPIVKMVVGQIAHIILAN